MSSESGLFLCPELLKALRSMSSVLYVARLEFRFPTNTLALPFDADPLTFGFLVELSDDFLVGCFPDSTKLLTTGLTCLEEERLLLWFECEPIYPP